MTAATGLCDLASHAEYHDDSGTCRLCALVASWPDPSPEQTDLIRRCLPPTEAAAIRSRTGDGRRAK